MGVEINFNFVESPIEKQIVYVKPFCAYQFSCLLPVSTTGIRGKVGTKDKQVELFLKAFKAINIIH